MAQKHERRTSPDRPKALLLTGPLAAGVIAVVWGGWHLGVHPAAGAPAPTVADRVLEGGTLADPLTPETITVRVLLSAALQTAVHEQAFSVTLPRGASVGTLLNQLADAYPVLAAMGPSVMVAVADRMEPPERMLSNGEVVDLVSPMAGG